MRKRETVRFLDSARVMFRWFLTVFLCLTFVLAVGASLTAGAGQQWVPVTVMIDPPEVRGTARFILENKQYVSGDTKSVKADKYYTIQFTSVDGYQTPADILVFVRPGDNITVTGTYLPSGGEPDTTVNDITRWPLWPQIRSVYNVWEPYSFMSIGRDVTSWVTFYPMEGNPTFWLSDLNVIIKSGELSFTKTGPDFDYSGQAYGYVTGGDLHDFPSSLSGILDDLRANAILPEHMTSWMTYVAGDTSEHYPNQDFDDSWFSYSGWKDFLRGDAGFDLEDSGHAPPVIMWDEDNWLTFFVDQNSVPSAWDGKVFLFLPTNQGVLNCFEVSDDPETLGVKRVWSITPFPAFQQAVYNQARRFQNEGQFSRMTVLDGPVYVHDVQDQNGDWKRILVGTTGLGTEQVNKMGAYWAAEGAPQPVGSPNITGQSRVFGIYAFDITDPLAPEPLWSVTNVSTPRTDGASVSRVDTWNAPGASIDEADYAEVDFMTTKPMIGFTESDAGDRRWHLLMVGVKKNGNYFWINADPMTGEVITKGIFDGFSDETAEALPSEDIYGFNFEDWYPSRMLAAYPGEGGLPVLSDVYIYLSNGTFYSWDLNRFGWSVGGSNIGAPVPEKIFNVYTNPSKEYPAPPITDFDICYINGDTYLAATAPLVYPGIGQSHDTYGLLIVNLTRIQDEGIENLNTQGALGQSGDTKLRLMETGVAMVQLQTGKGSHAYDFEELVASPIFANYVLYQAQYSTEGELSRLYTLDMGYIAGITRNNNGKGNASLPDDAYIDDFDNRYASMLIDSEGNLVLLDAEGNVVHIIEGVLDYSNVSAGAAGSSGSGVDTVYWKTR